jgi:hypothetical protein
MAAATCPGLVSSEASPSSHFRAPGDGEMLIPRITLWWFEALDPSPPEEGEVTSVKKGPVRDDLPARLRPIMWKNVGKHAKQGRAWRQGLQIMGGRSAALVNHELVIGASEEVNHAVREAGLEMGSPRKSEKGAGGGSGSLASCGLGGGEIIGAARGRAYKTGESSLQGGGERRCEKSLQGCGQVEGKESSGRGVEPAIKEERKLIHRSSSEEVSGAGGRGDHKGGKNEQGVAQRECADSLQGGNIQNECEESLQADSQNKCGLPLQARVGRKKSCNEEMRLEEIGFHTEEEPGGGDGVSGGLEDCLEKDAGNDARKWEAACEKDGGVLGERECAEIESEEEAGKREGGSAGAYSCGQESNGTSERDVEKGYGPSANRWEEGIAPKRMRNSLERGGCLARFPSPLEERLSIAPVVATSDRETAEGSGFDEIGKLVSMMAVGFRDQRMPVVQSDMSRKWPQGPFLTSAKSMRVGILAADSFKELLGGLQNSTSSLREPGESVPGSGNEGAKRRSLEPSDRDKAKRARVFCPGTLSVILCTVVVDFCPLSLLSVLFQRGVR